jgi:hypothetical protein
MGSRRRAIVVAIALALAAPNALAGPTAAQRETARRLMDEGKERTKAGDLPKALDAYKKAHDLMHVPTTGLALARTHVALGHLVEGRDVALEVVRLSHEPNEPPIFEDARKRSKELEASLKARIPSLKIAIKGGPAAKVAIDDTDIAALLLGEPIAMNPGHHVIVAKNADGIEARAEADLAEREAKEIELVLPEAKPVTVVAPAVTPPPSKKVVTLGGDDEARGQRTTAANVLVYGGFGVAIAGVAAGTIAGVIVLGKANDVKPKCENDICDPAARSDLDSAKSLALISTIGYAVAGAGTIAGVIGLILPKRPAAGSALQSKKAHAGVFFGPGSIVVRGTY